MSLIRQKKFRKMDSRLHSSYSHSIFVSLPSSPMSNNRQTKDKKNPVFSIIAGATAGGVEGAVTYPTEYIKTRLQLQEGSQLAAGQTRFKGPIDLLVHTVRTQGFFALYRGMSALVIGNTAKGAVRFLAFDQFAQLLRDDQGKLSGARSVLAGLGAGMTEAALVVTPSETIKTKLIHDQNTPNPKYRGLVHGVTSIIRAEGPGGVYRGLVPVMMRQGANSAVRFSVYSSLKTQMQRLRARPEDPLPSWVTFGIGAVAGIITVYTTMPLDVLKTKMQGLDAKKLYRNSLDCVMQVARKDGVLAFWKGATPRLARLMVSGGIAFTVYEEVYGLLQNFAPQVARVETGLE